jgi:hypothetical protein
MIQAIVPELIYNPQHLPALLHNLSRGEGSSLNRMIRTLQR